MIASDTRCDALRDALSRFETCGWVQGSYARTRALNVSWAHPAATAFDLVGMLERVAVEIDPAHAHELAEQLRVDVCRTIGELAGGFALEHWNDAPARTIEDVRYVLEETVLRLNGIQTMPGRAFV